jgi:putative ABC transport system permease protein
MSFLDLVLLILENLSRRKARVALTAVGVVIGSAAVVVLVSLAIGLQRNATSQLYGIGDLSLIQVNPGYSEVTMQGPVGGPGQPGNEIKLTTSALQDIAAIPGVETVIPRDFLMYGGMLNYQRLETWANLQGIGLQDLSELGLRAEQGTTVLERGTVIVGYRVSEQFYDPRLRPGQEPPPPPDLMNANLKLTLIKWTQDGVEVRKSVPLRVTGVLAQSGEADYTIYISIDEMTAFNEWGGGRRIDRNRDGYPFVTVKVSDVKNVLDISEQINAMGFQSYTPQAFVEGINSFYLVLQVIFGGVGAIALLVAAIGIANTMAMAILERTREIGLMKAIGATNRDVLSVFLGEAAGIGFVGGLGGVVVGWSAGQIINVLALAYFAGQAANQGGPPPALAVYTPAWLPIFALIFSVFIGLLSGLYPALRAATLIPVNALKYE